VPLPDEVEAAVAQVMTFLAENEFVALYLPAKLLPRLHPEYTEVALVLASQVKDEARHIEVFTKRALAGGKGLGKVEPATHWALRSLLSNDDFTEVAFLLHVVGEGTFLDLLRFLESHAPDEVTRQIMRRPDATRRAMWGMALTTSAGGSPASPSCPPGYWQPQSVGQPLCGPPPEPAQWSSVRSPRLQAGVAATRRSKPGWWP
jgi:hypothetical protein